MITDNESRISRDALFRVVSPKRRLRMSPRIIESKSRAEENFALAALAARGELAGAFYIDIELGHVTE